MKKYFLSLLLLLFTLTAEAQKETQQQFDSIRKVAATQHGLEKVETYLLLNSYLSETASLEEMIDFYNEFGNIILQEQKKEKKSDLIPVYRKKYATKQLNVCVTLYNFGEYDKAEKQARKTMEYCIENNEWVSYYKGYNLLLDVLMASQKYETVQREAKKLVKEAKARKGAHHTLGMVFATASLAGIYHKQSRFAEAENYYRECIDFAGKIDFASTCYILVEVHRELVQILLLQGKYNETLLALKEAERVVDKLTELETAGGYNNPITRLYLYEAYFDYYLAVKDLDKAEYYCNLVEEVFYSFADGETVFDGDLYMIRAELWEARGKYAEALEAIGKYQSWALDFGDTPLNENNILLIKARLLTLLGRGKESIALYDSVITSNNRMRDKVFNAQLDEIRTLHEIDKHIAEKEKVRNYLFYAMSVCMLLLLLLGFYVYYSQQIKKKNRGLYLQIIEQDKLVEELEAEHRKKLEQHPYFKQNLTLEENEENLELFFGKLTLLMKKQHLFTNSELKRKEVALQIGISDRGLHDCVKNSTGMGFTEYINTLRLSYSRELLSNMDEKFTIDTIAYESGFNSRTTFYRLFKEKYGLSPKQFREISRA